MAILLILETRQGKEQRDEEQITNTPTYRMRDKIGMEVHKWVASSHISTNDRQSQNRYPDISSHRYGVTETTQTRPFED